MLIYICDDCGFLGIEVDLDKKPIEDIKTRKCKKCGYDTKKYTYSCEEHIIEDCLDIIKQIFIIYRKQVIENHKQVTK
jgi:Zn ribbon nucleic-acid-binding protein